jgi:hypothetical protein
MTTAATATGITCRCAAARGLGGATTSGLSGTTAGRLCGATATGVTATAAVATEQPAAKEAAVASAATATSPGRATTTRRLGGTPATGITVIAAAKHASEHLERAGVRRSANEHRAGANHRKDDSTTHEERSFKKRGIETLTRHVNMGRARPKVGVAINLHPAAWNIAPSACRWSKGALASARRPSTRWFLAHALTCPDATQPCIAISPPAVPVPAPKCCVPGGRESGSRPGRRGAREAISAYRRPS